MPEKTPLVITEDSQAVAILMGDAIALCNERGQNYNAGVITKSSYNVFPLRYHAGEVHKEALRMCSWVEQGNIKKVREHLRDIVVWSAFLYEETSHYKDLDDCFGEMQESGAATTHSIPDQLLDDVASCGREKHQFQSSMFSGDSLCKVCGHSRGCPCHGK